MDCSSVVFVALESPAPVASDGPSPILVDCSSGVRVELGVFESEESDWPGKSGNVILALRLTLADGFGIILPKPPSEVVLADDDPSLG